MKKVSLLVLTLAVSLGFFGCSSLNEVVNTAGNIKSVSDSLPSSRSGNDIMPNDLSSGSVDFKSGEVLCGSSDSQDPLDVSYYLAKILKAPTAATKNQAQVIYVSDGKTDWANFVIQSHKASEKELVVGKVVFFGGCSGWENVSQDNYRQARWELGRVTNTDELFKGVVEVSGEKKFVKYVRVPDKNIE